MVAWFHVYGANISLVLSIPLEILVV